MKIIGKRSVKRTKLHIHKCELCKDDFGSYRTYSKVCSFKCKALLNGLQKLSGENRNCKTCGCSFWAKKSEDRRGGIRSFCTKTCMNTNKKLGLPTGQYLSYDGYIVVSTVGDGRKQIKQHRLIMENFLKRRLKTTEIVHHINENKIDNRLENLQVVSRAEHNQIHFKLMI